MATKHYSDDVWLGPLAQVKSSLRTPASYRLSSDRVTSGARVLNLLSNQVDVKTCVERYYVISSAVVIPWITLDKAIDAITLTLSDKHPTDAQRLVLVEDIFANTGEPLELDEYVTAETLHKSFTGANLRWEILGLLFTYLAFGMQMTEGDTSQKVLKRQEITSELVHASNVCVSFCDRAESLNDLLVWLCGHFTSHHTLTTF